MILMGIQYKLVWRLNRNHTEIEVQCLHTGALPEMKKKKTYQPRTLGMNLSPSHPSYPLPGFVRYESGAARVD